MFGLFPAPPAPPHSQPGSLRAPLRNKLRFWPAGLSQEPLPPPLPYPREGAGSKRAANPPWACLLGGCGVGGARAAAGGSNADPRGALERKDAGLRPREASEDIAPAARSSEGVGIADNKISWDSIHGPP